MSDVVLLCLVVLNFCTFALVVILHRRTSAKWGITEQYVCSCGHPQSLHHPSTRSCAGEIKRRRYNSIGSRIGFTHVACRCQQYDGEVRLTSEQILNVQLPTREDR